MHNLKVEEERKRITKEFEASYTQTIEDAQKAVAAVRKQCDEQVAVEKARFIQVKAEFEKYKTESDDRLNEAGAENLSLQDQIDDLQYKLDMLAKARSGADRSAAPKIETATGSAVCQCSTLALRKLPLLRTTKGDKEILELKTSAVLAQDAKAKLGKMLKKDRSRAGCRRRHASFASEV